MRRPDEILWELDLLTGGRGRELLWEVLEDVLDTVKSNGYWIFQRNIEDVDQLLTQTKDYLVNHYGDD